MRPPTMDEAIEGYVRLLTQPGPITPEQSREQHLRFWHAHLTQEMFDPERVRIVDSFLDA